MIPLREICLMWLTTNVLLFSNVVVNAERLGERSASRNLVWECLEGKELRPNGVSCAACKVGTFKPERGNHDCTECPEGQVQPLRGKAYCCPAEDPECDPPVAEEEEEEETEEEKEETEGDEEDPAGPARETGPPQTPAPSPGVVGSRLDLVRGMGAPEKLAVVRDKIYFAYREEDIVGWKKFEAGNNRPRALNMTGAWPVHFEAWGANQVLIFTSAKGIFLYDETSKEVVSIHNVDERPLKIAEHEFLKFQDKVYFMGSPRWGSNQELWVTDGTPEGTSQVTDIHPRKGNSLPEGFVATANRLYFTASDDGVNRSLYTTTGDGTTQNVENIPDGVELDLHWGHVVKDNTILLSATHPDIPTALWTLNEALEFEILFADVLPGTESWSTNPFLMEKGGSSDGTSLFTTGKGSLSDPHTVWISDGTLENTQSLITVPSTAEERHRKSHVGTFSKRYHSEHYFVAFVPQPPNYQGEWEFLLYKTMGTANATSLVFSTKCGAQTAAREFLVVMNDKLYFPLKTGGANLTSWELWVTEGTSNSTRVQPIHWKDQAGRRSLNANVNDMYVYQDMMILPHNDELWSIQFNEEEEEEVMEGGANVAASKTEP